MKKTIKNIFTKLTPWSVDNYFLQGNYNSKKDVKFILSYKGKKIGVLEHKNDKWIFQYSEEFINNQFVSPLMDFPVVKKVYQFDELPPFFAARIPNLNQPFHQKKLTKYGGDKNDIVYLLEIFGRKSINNPFELTAN